MSYLKVNFHSEALGMATEVDVLLPNRTMFGDHIHNPETFSTLYLLHGMMGDQTNWMRASNIERYVSRLNLAVVMPRTDLGWYSNTKYGIRYYDYLVKELPKRMCDMFRGMSPKREDTYIAGLSMGGFGAFKAALSAPEVYSFAASLSGALDTRGRLEGEHSEQYPLAYWQGVFGCGPIEGTDMDPLYLATRCKETAEKLPDLYMWCGTEDSLLEANHTMRDHLKSLSFPCVYEESEGIHAWEYWDLHIQDVLKYLVELHPNLKL